MASTDDEHAQPPAKRLRHDAQAERAAATAVARVEINPADCNLDFDVVGGGLQGQALHEGGFAYCWSGARATVGVRGGGKYCFGCRIVAEQPAEMDDTSTDQRHLCRVGVSRGDDPVGALGESGHSFGFGGTGKLSHQGKFVHYGVKFGVGDTVVCAVDLDCKPMASIGFSRNGEWLGVAKHFDASDKGLGLVDSPLSPMQWESAIFPHVLLKNVVVEMQFSREDGLEPVDGYEPWALACANGNTVLGPVFAEQKECEVMMMVGLPASGKSTWAEKWVKDHPEKRFVLLGTNLALDQMKVPGLLRKHNYGERFDRLMDHATVIFNTLLDRAAKTPRNYIIDQTNVYKSARIRKLRPFANYRKVAVVMFPLSSELKSRAEKRFKEMGKEVPTEAVDQMIANFVLPLSKDMPGSKEPFHEVIFVELSRNDAQRNLDAMKHLLPRASTPSYDNLNNQNSSSTHTGTIPPGVSVARSYLPGFQPPMDNSYGRGVHALGDMSHQQAPLGVQDFQSTAGNQHQFQSSYLNVPYEHQTHTSYPNAPNQHIARPGYPGATYQHQIHPSYSSNPFPVYEHRTSGYGARPPLHVHELTPATSSSHPVQQMAHHNTISPWSFGNYEPYEQQPFGVHNEGSQYAAPVPRPPLSLSGALPPNYTTGSQYSAPVPRPTCGALSPPNYITGSQYPAPVLRPPPRGALSPPNHGAPLPSPWYN